MIYQLLGITSSKDLRPNTLLTCGTTCGNHKPHSIIRLSNRCTQCRSPTWHPCPNWASQPHFPRGRLPGTRNQKRGRRGEQVLDQRMHKESIILSNRRVIADFNPPTIPKCLKHSTWKDLSTTHPQTIIALTQNVHIHQLRIHLHVSLTLSSLLWLPFEEESPVGRLWMHNQLPLKG